MNAGVSLRAAAWTACGLLLAGSASAQAPKAVSLADAVTEALSKNERLVNQADTIAQADLSLRLARNTFRPKVTPNIFGSFGRTDVSSQTYRVAPLRLARNTFRPKVTPNIFGSFGRTDVSSQTYRVDVSQKLVTGTELRLSTGTASAQIPGMDSAGDVLFYNADTTLTLTQPLLRGFGPSVARRSLTVAEMRKEDAARSQSLAEQQVAVEVAGAYYRVVSQQTFVEVARQSLLRARRLRDASEAKLDAGLVSQLDVLRSQMSCARNSWSRKPSSSCSMRSRRSKTRAISCRS